MKKALMMVLGLALMSGVVQASEFEISAKELRAILDVPVLGDLLNRGKIQSIQRISGSDIYEVSTSFCKAQIRVRLDPGGVQSPKAESVGAECGP